MKAAYKIQLFCFTRKQFENTMYKGCITKGVQFLRIT